MASKEEQKSILSKLPRDYSWSNDFPLCNHQGFWYVPILIERTLEVQKQDPSEFSLTSSDIIICSAPKTGTTWLKSLAFAVTTRTRFNFTHHPLLSSNAHDLIPLIEMDLNHNQTTRNPDLPLLSTHIPYTALPTSVLDLGCKIVYIYRNPKDVFVSLWHFMQKMIHEKDPVPLEKAFDLFCKGVSIYGPYWDHVLEYWNASLECPDKILFLKYEDMMNDVESHVRRLAAFMGCGFTEEEDREGVDKRIVELCSFASLSKLTVNRIGMHRNAFCNSSFFRKAEMEDWRNYLTQEMANKLDMITVEKFGHVGLVV